MQTPTLLMGLPDGADADKKRETLKLMRDLTRSGKRDPAVHDFACSLIQGCPPKNWRCEIECLWRWVLDNIRYTNDITDVETISDAQGVLDRGWGDCDDVSLLLATMLETTGHRTRFVALGKSYGDFTHVIVEARCGNGWIPLDATENRAFGWSPPDMPFAMQMHNSG